MKTKVSKKISSLVLALAIAFTAVFASAVPAEAATDRATLVSEQDTASAGVAKAYTFEVPTEGVVNFDIAVPERVGFQTKVTKQTGETILDEYTSSTDSYWESSQGVWLNGFYGTLSAGSYTLELTFDSNTQYIVMVTQDKEVAKINQEKATITVGFTKKLSVSGGKVSSWSSKNKKVATVDKNGKVTAKKAGKAVIVAKCTDGTELRCNVTVKANQYTARKITTSDVSYGDTAMSAYKVSFDKKGNLVIKARYVNRMSYKVSELRNIKITVKDANGKTVGTYKQSKKKVSVSSGSTKDFTFTIKKSNLKKKKADLRGGEVSIDGTSYYYVYY